MKKLNTSKVIALLAALCLVTSCFVGSTLARYTTTGEGTDTARVAKWGITFNNSGKSTFSATYDSSVASKNGTELVVAPGTTDSGTYALDGAPETDYEVSFTMAADEDVFLGGSKAYTYDTAKGYADGMSLEKTDTATEYHPIKWTVKLETTVADDTDITDAVDSDSVNPLVKGDNAYDTLADAAAAIQATKIKYEANEDCDATITITWDWAFTQSEDVKDTVLGDLAAKRAGDTVAVETTAVEGVDYNLDVKYTFTMTATQLD